MAEDETLVVFRILGVLAKARNLGYALPVDEIANAAHLGRPQAERYVNLLEHAGAIRGEVTSSQRPEYNLTRYGLQRLVGGCAR
jgi:DNA-binding IclR family transcriptional regulator